MNNKEKIIDLYYNQHWKQCIIVETLGVSKQYVSKIIKNDNRYLQVKEKHKQESYIKRKNYLKEYFKNYHRSKKDDDSYKYMLQLQKQDAKELSYNNYLSDYALAKWCSCYHTDKKGNLIIDRKLNVGADIPRKINMNIKVPTQKYKRKYTYSY